MATSLYKEEEADLRFKGDTLTVDFSTYQKYITCTAGSTVYRIPVFDNA